MAGTCQSSLCNGVACAAGLACVGTTCTDRNCQGVSCPAGRSCTQGACVVTGATVQLSDFSSGAAFGELQQGNVTHLNRAVLGEPTPPIDTVLQNNGTHTNQGGFVTSLQQP